MAHALLMLAVLAVILLMVFQSEALRVPPTPTRRKVREAVVDLLRPENPASIIELGSGWGGMANTLAAAFPEAHITCYERAVIPYLWCRIFARNPRISFQKADIFGADLAKADAVVCYLSPWHMQKLEAKLDTSMKSGACLVSASFPLS
ncbi:MAG: hypothetical protein KGQ41_00975, partial [Alphaproteobacteria bacterium]|nr:hypothetical protein [Alphaproteobacteria bacterium]